MGSRGGEELGVGLAARPLVSLLGSLEEAVERLDPGQAPARDAADLVRVLDRIARVADAAKLLAASRVAESSLWSRGGHESPAHWMSRETGVGVGDAAELLRTAEAVAAAPVAKDALVAGRLSPRQARAVGRAEAVDPGAGRTLVDTAASVSVTELETEAGRIVAAASQEAPEAKAERHHRARRFRHGVNADGMGWGSWLLPMAEHARAVARIQGEQGRVFEQARAAGEREPSEAYAADALCRVLDRAGGVGGEVVDHWSFAKVIVRADLQALDRGEVAPGELCEVAGQGPVPVADVWRMIDGGAFVAAVASEGAEIDKVVHLGRRPTVLQRTALEWATAGTCVIRGCDSVARTEIDHVAEWSRTGRTELRELAAPCGHHHDLKTHHGYRFGPVEADGKRRLVPPDDAEVSSASGAGPAGRDGPDPPPRDGPDPPPPEGRGVSPVCGPDPPPVAELRPLGDAPSVAERARAIARSRAAHPSQGALFHTG